MTCTVSHTGCYEVIRSVMRSNWFHLRLKNKIRQDSWTEHIYKVAWLEMWGLISKKKLKLFLINNNCRVARITNVIPRIIGASSSPAISQVIS